MAKFAVIFVLFALCSVAMSASVPQEEPTPLQNFLNSLAALGKGASEYVQGSKTQNQFKDIEEKSQILAKKTGEGIQEVAADLQTKIQNFIQENEGLKKIAEDFQKSVDDFTKPKKN
ncbi:uncharacterized protein LOC110190985 [Drosophila serrata]|uniref:uncharacterized protein LOC110190985 n=1 Tax=Drosophila serrata TaxID=7274 RepID=UPI000A1D290D|nr:uncharacterized protein LOC110190985 [Drosophila serrata]